METTNTTPGSDPRAAGGIARSGLFTRLSLLILALAASLGLAEAALRFRASRQGRPFDPATGLAEIRSAALIMREGLRGPGGSRDAPEPGLAKYLHPYFGWDQENPNVDYERERRTFRRQSSAQALDILILGGSVAAGFAGEGRRALFDALLSDPRCADLPMRIYHHGVAAYKQPQQLIRLAYLLTLGITPDVVINLDGFNEVALGMANAAQGVHPLHPSAGHWTSVLVEQGLDRSMSEEALDALAELRYLQKRARRDVERAEQMGLQRTALTTALAVMWLRRERRRGLSVYEDFRAASGQGRGVLDPRYGPAFDDDDGSAIEMLVEGWASASRALQGMCTASGIAYLHVLQPTLHDEGSKPLTQAELDGSDCSPEWLEGVRLGYPLLRAAGNRLAEGGVSFFDASGVFADHHGTLYADACHFTPEGYALLGTMIGRELLERFPEGDLRRPARGVRVKSVNEQE